MKVSVIIPTWNRGYIIEKTIASVLSQTIEDLEVLVCDDGSTDDTEERVRNIDDDRVVFVSGTRGGRPAIPRNIGLRYARGEWIAFLDSDDEWFPEKLELQLEFAMRLGLKAVVANAMRFEPEKGITGLYLDVGRQLISFEDLLIVNEVITSTALIHRSLFEKIIGFPESADMTVGEDYATWLRVASFDNIGYIQKSLIIYRDDPEHSVRKEGITDVWLQKKIILQDFVTWSKKYGCENRTFQVLKVLEELESQNTNYHKLRKYIISFLRKLPRVNQLLLKIKNN